MQIDQPSLTALGAARLRAAHQLLDGASILVDTLATRILGPDIENALRHARLCDHFSRSYMPGPELRWFIAARARIAEDALKAAANEGAAQFVILGAGFDTLAYRTPLAARLRIFEVDHAATQARKREMLTAAAIPVPQSLSYVAMDFERETLADVLGSAGFATAERTFFSWLGVVPYLTEPAIWRTLGYIAQLQGGADVVFDYLNQTGSFTPVSCAEYRDLAAEVTAAGEQIQSYFETAPLCAKLNMIGFRRVEDTSPKSIAARFFPVATSSQPDKGGHIMRASTI
ncbi:class I SAM-dependent methyltransferase [Bradyrhizobium sp. JYMT SZCCT0428]|uniref:class I SAM-dependent methyltransferase n=1 Tax=Bradyrhizobium sp. JYMT SZCCT0428 TaxID=2807673 RepID=UPI001BAA353F|nr:class I SAM-dependent methyltransferase [Bradyrhizobium sp. JYMT SZCCT0428]MBR1155196.1 class I SAM-dependent methyltransferase [Bradyrhizobium sp. JYMT SZCCT0428]